MTHPYHELVRQVEADHWWFVSLRELVRGLLTATVPPGAKVLEVGCGSGGLLADLPSTYQRAGIDLEVAVAARHPEITVLEASVDEIPFRDGSFDAVLALDVVSAVGVHDDRAALQEISRVLRPGGVFILQVAAYEWLRSGHDAAAGTARRYTLPAIRELLRGAGLQPRHLTYRVTFLFPLAVAHRLSTRGKVQNDVGAVNPILNRLLTAIMRLENRLARRTRLPFGLSVFAVATRRDAPADTMSWARSPASQHLGDL